MMSTHSMLFSLFTGALVSTSLALLQPASPVQIPPREVVGIEFDEFYSLTYFAVLEGLYTDGVSDDVLKSLTRTDEVSNYPELFIWQCPICMPAFNAFMHYGKRQPFMGIKARVDTFGAGLSEEMRLRCLAEDKLVRFGALNELVEGWVDRRLASMRLTEGEQNRWEQGFVERRKKGMATMQSMQGAGAYAGLKTCALCNAAADASASD